MTVQLTPQQEKDLRGKLQALRAEVRRRAREDYPWFIRNYIKIERKDVPGMIDLFALWPFQVEALRKMLAVKRLIIPKARQLGLSWLVLAYGGCRMLFEPGYRVAAISKTDDESKEMARRLKVILENLPDWIVREHKKKNFGWGGPTYEANSDKIVIHHPPVNGKPQADSIFTALPQSSESGRSLTGHLLILDEFAYHDYAEDIWTAALPTISDGPGQVVVISTGNKGTKFEGLVRDALGGDSIFEMLFFPWDARPDRDQEWYEERKKENPNSYRREYPATIEDAFSAGQGRFFPEYAEEVHIIRGWQPPMWWRRWAAYDPGYSSNASFCWYAMEPEGRYVVAYREYYPKQVIDEKQAETVLDWSRYEDGSSEQLEICLTDREAWNASSEAGQSTAEIFLEKGIPLVQAAKSKLALRNGWRRLHAFLRPIDGPLPGEKNGGPIRRDGKWARLMFTENCVHTRRQMPAAVEAKNDPEDIAKQSEHHAIDCHRMLTFHYPLDIPGAPSAQWNAEWGPDPAAVREETERRLPWALQEDARGELDEW